MFGKKKDDKQKDQTKGKASGKGTKSFDDYTQEHWVIKGEMAYVYAHSAKTGTLSLYYPKSNTLGNIPASKLESSGAPTQHSKCNCFAGAMKLAKAKYGLKTAPDLMSKP